MYSHQHSGMLGHVCPQRRQQPWKDHQCSSVRRPPSRATFPLHPSHIRTVTIDLHDRSSPPWAAMTLQHSCTRAGNPPSAIVLGSHALLRCVTCIVADHPSNGILISRIVGLMDRLRTLKLSKASSVTIPAAQILPPVTPPRTLKCLARLAALRT